MAFSSLEELKAAVEQRRQETLTMEISLDAPYSEEHEQAKRELQMAEVTKAIVGGGFLGDNLDQLKQRVADTRPETQSVWVRFRKLELDAWAALTKQAGLTATDQFDKVLPETFVALYGEDPSPDAPEDADETWVAPVVEPLSTDYKLLSPTSGEFILPGSGLHSVVQTFMAWQNSGGDVTIRPTKSGRA